MKIKYDFFKKVIHSLNTTNTIFSTLQMFGMICQATKTLLFQELSCIGFFFFFNNINSKAKNWTWQGYKTTKVTCQCKEDSSMRLIHKDHILCLILSS